MSQFASSDLLNREYQVDDVQEVKDLTVLVFKVSDTLILASDSRHLSLYFTSANKLVEATHILALMVQIH